MNWNFCLGLTKTFQCLYHIIHCNYLINLRIWSRVLMIHLYNTSKTYKWRMQDLCKQDPKSICKVGKYNFPSSNAFVGVKQTTLVGFVGFTSFLQTYCHNLQCLSLMKHCQHKCEQNVSRSWDKLHFLFTGSTNPILSSCKQVSPLKRFFPQGVS